eukprot:scaffold43754_cov19-Tisochrysis_lutea.AAC.2
MLTFLPPCRDNMVGHRRKVGSYQQCACAIGILFQHLQACPLHSLLLHRRDTIYRKQKKKVVGQLIWDAMSAGQVYN